MHRLHNLRKGNAVIIISLMLLVSGIALGALFKPQLPVERDKADLTRERLKVIRQRLYFIRDASGAGMERAYPCPAIKTYAESHDDFGKADCNSTTTATPNLLSGAVPVRNLKLHSNYAFDGWGRAFTYIKQDSTPPTAALEVTNISGTNEPLYSNEYPGLDLSHLVVAIISHGPDGRGARTKSGSLFADCSGLRPDGLQNRADLENCDNDVDLIYDKWNEALGYDDILIGVDVEGAAPGDACGDLIISGRGNEECDNDPVPVSGDGCSSTCQWESPDPGFCGSHGGEWFGGTPPSCNGHTDFQLACQELYGPSYNYCEGSQMCLEGFC